MYSLADSKNPACCQSHDCVADYDQLPASPIIAAFRARGSTARKWALRNGYRPSTVFRVISVWGPRRDKSPLGGISRQIMDGLREELGADVVPLPGDDLNRLERAA